MPTVDDQNDKVREQIEEILAKDESRNPGPIRIAKPTPARRARQGTPIWYPTPEKLIFVGVGLLVLAVILRQFVLPLTVGGFAIAAVGYYMLLKRRRATKRPGDEGVKGYLVMEKAKYWRGLRVDDKPPAKRRDGNILDFPDIKDEKRH